MGSMLRLTWLQLLVFLAFAEASMDDSEGSSNSSIHLTRSHTRHWLSSIICWDVASRDQFELTAMEQDFLGGTRVWNCSCSLEDSVLREQVHL